MLLREIFRAIEILLLMEGKHECTVHGQSGLLDYIRN